MTRRTVLALLTVVAGSAMAAPWALAHPGHDHKVLGSEAQAFRLGLITATKSVIARSLDLIGVEAPDRM